MTSDRADAPASAPSGPEGSGNKEEAEPACQPGVNSSASLARWPLPGRNLRLLLAFGLPCLVIGVDAYFIIRAPRRPSASTIAVAPPQPSAPSAAGTNKEDTAASPSAVPRLQAESDATPVPAFEDENDLEEPHPRRPEPPRRYANVQEAALHSCSTSSIEGLSRQLVEQSRCIDPQAFAPLPNRKNLVLGEQVLGYLEASARDHLLRVLDSHRDTTMTINSALRTIAQQYLVWQWSSSRRCGVQLAQPPGESEHEAGLALDIADHAQWRAALESEKFHWLGASDRVHFNFEPRRAARKPGTDVLAFQQLWNRSHPEDRIPENGRYSAATEERLKKAPATGFPKRPRCR